MFSSKHYLDCVRGTIGDSAFNNMLAMQGQVTLMFAIDDTGSMRNEISAARKIATSIVNVQRVEPVDYILSPFNDPGMHSPNLVTVCNAFRKPLGKKLINHIAVQNIN